MARSSKLKIKNYSIRKIEYLYYIKSIKLLMSIIFSKIF
jgi:hypothetical protein